jgi:hypothetical protein
MSFLRKTHRSVISTILSQLLKHHQLPHLPPPQIRPIRRTSNFLTCPHPVSSAPGDGRAFLTVSLISPIRTLTQSPLCSTSGPMLAPISTRLLAKASNKHPTSSIVAHSSVVAPSSTALRFRSRISLSIRCCRCPNFSSHLASCVAFSASSGQAPASTPGLPRSATFPSKTPRHCHLRRSPSRSSSPSHQAHLHGPSSDTSLRKRIASIRFHLWRSRALASRRTHQSAS